MKKLLRTLLCGAMLVLTMSTAAFAADADLLTGAAPVMPERQGDFYVMVNGEFVTFPDAVPQAKSDRSFLPMAATFSQLGFPQEQMTWNTEGLITATKGDLTIALTLGKNEIVLTEDGKSTTITTDVAPYVDPATWRTYVPFGLVADALGYNVGWDGTNKAVIIDDVDAILAENTETYQLMDKYLAYSQELTKGKVALNGTLSLGVAVSTWDAETSSDFALTAEGDYTLLSANATAMQFTTDLDLNLAIRADGEDITADMLASEELASIPDSIDLELRGDLENGAFYLKSAALCQLLEQADMANAWFKLDMASLLSAAGMDYSSLMSEMKSTSFSDTIASLLKATPVNSITATTRDNLALYNAMFADSAFVKDGTVYINDMSELGLPMALAVYTNKSGTKATGAGVEMILSDPTVGDIEMLYAIEGKELAMYMLLDSTMEATADSGLSFYLELLMDGTYKSSSKSPATQPPANAVVIDLMAGL